MTPDRDTLDRATPEVLHRVLDGLRRLPDQRTGSDRAAAPASDTPADDAVLPRRR